MRARVIHGPRVSLRPLAAADAPRLARWLADPEVIRELDHGPVTVADEEAFIARADASAELIACAIVVRAGAQAEDSGVAGEAIGWIDLALDRVPELGSAPGFDGGAAWLGIVIGARAWWGQGLGAEATQLAVAIAFEVFDVGRVALTVNATNAAAIRCYQRVGFTVTEVRAGAARVGGAPVDEWVMQRARR